jgi:hypothetical protein
MTDDREKALDEALRERDRLWGKEIARAFQADDPAVALLPPLGDLAANAKRIRELFREAEADALTNLFAVKLVIVKALGLEGDPNDITLGDVEDAIRERIPVAEVRQLLLEVTNGDVEAVERALLRSQQHGANQTG